MKILIDAREYNYFSVLSEMTGASELCLLNLAKTLASQGHDVNVITWLDDDVYQDGIYFWPRNRWPKHCDLLITCEQAMALRDFTFEKCILSLNRLDPIIDQDMFGKVDRVVVCTDYHREALIRFRSFIKSEQCVSIAPGITPGDYANGHVPKVPKRLIYSNSPGRGLYHLMDAWPALKKKIPDVSLTITYDFDRYYKSQMWEQTFEGLKVNEINRWIDSEPNVLNLGGLSRKELIEEQLKAELFPFPCDPPRYGSQLHCTAALESGAAGSALMLSAQEALPEVFGDVAVFLGLPIYADDWAYAIHDLLRDKAKLRKYQWKARAYANDWTWERHGQAWANLVEEVCNASH